MSALNSSTRHQGDVSPGERVGGNKGHETHDQLTELVLLFFIISQQMWVVRYVCYGMPKGSQRRQLIPWLGRGLPGVRDLCELTRRPNLPLQGVRPYGLNDN